MATIETIRFKLREGVRESDFVTFNREVQTEYMELQPGFRWVELAFPGGEGASLSLVTTGDELPTGIDTGIRLLTPDASAAHELLSGKGLDVGELLDWESTPLMFSFLDPDGNRFYVSQDS